MGDSNPRSGDWGNTMRGIYVAGGGMILIALFFALGVTGHRKAAIVLFTLLCLGVIVTAAILAGRHERDH